ncbi:MAG TPA: diaminopimelate epimerase [Acidimicrobiales bacterium]|nr:diaminopimelate epimerase [Acidimicrobiales bacterium]
MRLQKYQALGNDFLIAFDHPVDAAVARAVCDRHLGAGADGLIRGTRGDAEADVAMELWNADGSRAETSGNGLRCLARAVVDAGLVAGPVLVIATDAGLRRATLGADGLVSVEMGAVRVVERDGDDPRWLGFADAGNPHVVLGVDDPTKEDLEEDGPAWERAYGGVNVEYVAAGPAPDELTMRVWERGVGETMACGSGACAAAVVARRAGMVGERVTVHQPGGDVLVDLSGPTVVLTGPAHYVCTVEFPDGPGRGRGPASGRRAGSGPRPGEETWPS